LGDAKALAKMLLYNKHDVLILEQVFKKMRPQLPPAVNMRFFSDELCCEHCGSKLLQARGVQRTKAMTWQRYQCQKCGGWMRGNGKAISKRG
jgi:predicted SprT family Zn-dependent metalloprotease